MKINKEKFVDEFELRGFGAKNWLSSKLLICPECGGKDKFGILFSENGGGVYHCFKCDKKGSLFSLLHKINRKDLIIGNQDDFTYKDNLDAFLLDFEVREENLICQEIKKPLGFKFLRFDSYLESRGWEDWQYEMYCAGSSIDPKLKNKVVFLLKEDDRVIGYLSRSKYDKEWHKRNLEQYKKGECRLVTRYENSTNTEFEKVVGGIDEIVEGETNTVLLVEGIMDKANVDKVLGLYQSSLIKCCFTFGCKLSEYQMLKIYKKGVENIILLYDPGTIQQVKSTSLRLMRYFDILIGELKGDKDPGEMNFLDFEKVFLSLLNPIDYFANRIQIPNLK